MYLGKTKALISCPVTTQLICAFVFACAKSRFSHDATQLAYLESHFYFVKLWFTQVLIVFSYFKALPSSHISVIMVLKD